MHRSNILKLCCLAWFLGPGVSEARLFRPWLPEELEPQASLICNGTVLSIEETGIKKDFSYPNINPSSSREIVMLAKIKVLHVFKGEAPAEFEFRYRISDPSKPEDNGAMHIGLEKGKRYRFFLKPGDAPGQYVGVLDGDFDDNFAVEMLWPNEPDDSPYLHKEEALKIARDFLKVKNLDSQVDWSQANWSHPNVQCFPEGEKGATWNVLLFHPLGQPSGALVIAIRGDRTIDPDQTRLKND